MFAGEPENKNGDWTSTVDRVYELETSPGVKKECPVGFGYLISQSVTGTLSKINNQLTETDWKC